LGTPRGFVSLAALFAEQRVTANDHTCWQNAERIADEKRLDFRLSERDKSVEKKILSRNPDGKGGVET
jgi:hypothetical protein